jgi:hypothetical protein
MNGGVGSIELPHLFGGSLNVCSSAKDASGIAGDVHAEFGPP